MSWENSSLFQGSLWSNLLSVGRQKVLPRRRETNKSLPLTYSLRTQLMFFYYPRPAWDPSRSEGTSKVIDSCKLLLLCWDGSHWYTKMRTKGGKYCRTTPRNSRERPYFWQSDGTLKVGLSLRDSKCVLTSLCVRLTSLVCMVYYVFPRSWFPFLWLAMDSEEGRVTEFHLSK